jgi:hypothetical protein
MVVPWNAFSRLHPEGLELDRARHWIARTKTAKVVAGNGARNETDGLDGQSRTNQQSHKSYSDSKPNLYLS